MGFDGCHSDRVTQRGSLRSQKGSLRMVHDNDLIGSVLPNEKGVGISGPSNPGVYSLKQKRGVITGPGTGNFCHVSHRPQPIDLSSFRRCTFKNKPSCPTCTSRPSVIRNLRHSEDAVSIHSSRGFLLTFTYGYRHMCPTRTNLTRPDIGK